MGFGFGSTGLKAAGEAGRGEKDEAQRRHDAHGINASAVANERLKVLELRY